MLFREYCEVGRCEKAQQNVTENEHSERREGQQGGKKHATAKKRKQAFVGKERQGNIRRGKKRKEKKDKENRGKRGHEAN